MSEENGIVKGERIVLIPLDKLAIRPDFNPRFIFEETKMDELKDDIRKRGILDPLEVIPIEGNVFDIVDGQRRFICAGELGLERVPCLVLPAFTTEEELISRAVSHSKGIPLTPLEIGALCHKMVANFGKRLEDLVSLFSYSIQSLQNFMAVYRSAAPETIEQIKNGEITFTEAVKEVRSGKKAVVTEEKRKRKEAEKEKKGKVYMDILDLQEEILSFVPEKEQDSFMEKYWDTLDYILTRFEKFAPKKEKEEKEEEKEDVETEKSEKKKGRGRPPKQQKEEEIEPEEEEIVDDELDGLNDEEDEISLDDIDSLEELELDDENL